MEIKRRKAKSVKIGNLTIGSSHPVAIQSMTKTKTSDVEATLKQIKELARQGCQIIRLAIKDSADAGALKKIKAGSKIPLVADIHFSYKLAIAAIENGADKIRLNPGNIDKPEEIKTVISALKQARIPLRIGLNSGSVQDNGPRKSSMTDRLVKSCLNYVKIIEKQKFHNIVISLKANNVLDTIESYRKVSRLCGYPLHLGLTATGSSFNGMIKSSVAIGALLLEGIGDTIRVSLTDNPVEEVKAAKGILESLGLFNSGIQIISCPTCGRCEVDLINIVKELEAKLGGQKPVKRSDPLKIAIMGCVVNGPGEAKGVDLGLAFGKNEGLLFSNGKIVRKIAAKDSVRVLLREIKQRSKT